jgi:hypothetical protein
MEEYATLLANHT